MNPLDEELRDLFYNIGCNNPPWVRQPRSVEEVIGRGVSVFKREIVGGYFPSTSLSCDTFVNMLVRRDWASNLDHASDYLNRLFAQGSVPFPGWYFRRLEFERCSLQAAGSLKKVSPAYG